MKIKLLGINRSVNAEITGTLSVVIKDPPAWLRKMERQRGVFSNGPVHLNLFKLSGKEQVFGDSTFMGNWEVK